jgi:hypothetical protein
MGRTLHTESKGVCKLIISDENREEPVNENENDKKKVWLTEEEKAIFGKRFPKGYKRVKLLGK